MIALTELAPDQQERIGQALARIIGDLDAAPQTFHGRNRAYLDRLGAALRAWNSAKSHDAVLADAASRMDTVCRRLPETAPEQATCRAVLASESGPRS